MGCSGPTTILFLPIPRLPIRSPLIPSPIDPVPMKE
jgi:hypothetical protein